MKMLKFLSIIPARGGSKGIPKKNIIELAGKPLIAWTIEASLKSKYISKTIVSSDSDEILNIASKYNCHTIKRPGELATDEANSQVVIEHVLKNINADSYDYLLLLQPTSPLRDSKDIDLAIEKIIEKKATALISVYTPEHTPLKAFLQNEEGFLKGLVNNKYPFLRRQDLPTVYMPNGAIYIIKIDEFLKHKQLFTNQTIHYKMSIEKSLDIDTFEDLHLVSKILSKGKQ